MSQVDDTERRRRWRLMVGGDRPSSAAACEGAGGLPLSPDDRAVDEALGALYDGDGAPSGRSRRGGLGASAPALTRWLGDIRTYFPSTVVQVMQKDAIERLDLRALLLEPELLGALEPDVHLVSTLVSLGHLMPEQSRHTAREVVGRVVKEVEERIAEPTRTAVRGALDRSARTRRPRPADIDWNRTVRANLRHWLPEHRTVVPETLIGYARRSTRVEREIVLAVDQSGSMAESVVYSAIFGAVMASIRSVRTSMVVFDTNVVDLTDQLTDPVEVLFATQLGGGTDINRAVAYCQELITRPEETLFVLISDLYEGGVREELLRRVRQLAASGVQVVVLLALSDSGAPSYDHDVAGALAQLGVPAFACTPDAFPDLLATALAHGDVAGWAERFEERRAAGA